MKHCFKIMTATALCMLSVLAGNAQREYPGSPGLPDDVVWMREIYRTLDLTNDTNGALYYPVEPQGDRINLFSTMFRLLAQKKIPAYEYQLDGTERFRKDVEVTFRDVLDRFQIYYELKKVENRRDSVLSINNSDIPSADVMSYFVKEVWYFDQRTSAYGSVITAICPVLHRSEEFSTEKVKLPMFWINYNDLKPHLTNSKVAVSNYNNAANSTWDDFFTARLYKGSIYKVTNLQNRVLSQYCTTDSAMTKEQKRIEQELMDFEKTLYGNDLVAENDSIAATPEAKATKSNSKKKGRDSATTAKRKSTSSQGKAKASASKAKSVSKRESAAPKASVRRQRR